MGQWHTRVSLTGVSLFKFIAVWCVSCSIVEYQLQLMSFLCFVDAGKASVWGRCISMSVVFGSFNSRTIQIARTASVLQQRALSVQSAFPCQFIWFRWSRWQGTLRDVPHEWVSDLIKLSLISHNTPTPTPRVPLLDGCCSIICNPARLLWTCTWMKMGMTVLSWGQASVSHFGQLFVLKWNDPF